MVPSVSDVIDGVAVIPLRTFPDERGTVYRMLKATDPHFTRFGEIYFSTVYPGVVKAWKAHRRATAHYACVFGEVKVALYDDRQASATRGASMELRIGPDHYALVVIPPGIWHGFQGMREPLAIIANCVTEPHVDGEVDRLDPTTPKIPHRW